MYLKKIFFLLFLGFTSLPFQASSQFSFDSAAWVKNNPGLYAILVTQNHELVYQHYFNQKTNMDLFNDQSLTKSIMALLIGIAIDKHYIDSLDEKAVTFLPETLRNLDKRKATITIRQIMNQSSGLYHEDLTQLSVYLSLDNPASYTWEQPLLTDPGSVFHYSNAASHLLSVILTQATGMTTRDFADRYLFKPMGIQDLEWPKMKDGYYDGSGLLSIRMQIRDMNKIGQLVLDSGMYNGRPVLSKGFITELMTPRKMFPTNWGLPGSEYGLCWYHKIYKGVPVLYGLGWGGQFNFVIPAYQAVITVNQSIADQEAIRESNLFLEKIFPLVFREVSGR
jgi:CubicO group peptidase (beta-lactamase class C family)